MLFVHCRYNLGKATLAASLNLLLQVFFKLKGTEMLHIKLLKEAILLFFGSIRIVKVFIADEDLSNDSSTYISQKTDEFCKSLKKWLNDSLGTSFGFCYYDGYFSLSVEKEIKVNSVKLCLDQCILLSHFISLRCGMYLSHLELITMMKLTKGGLILSRR